MVKEPSSKGLQQYLFDESIPTMKPEDVRERCFVLGFPADTHGKPQPAEISLRLHAPNFEPPLQTKRLRVPPSGDSLPCTFLISPTVAGDLVANLELLRGEEIVVSRSIRTHAVVSEAPASAELNVISIPLRIFVYHPATFPMRGARKSTAPVGEGIIASETEIITPGNKQNNAQMRKVRSSELSDGPKHELHKKVADVSGTTRLIAIAGPGSSPATLAQPPKPVQSPKARHRKAAGWPTAIIALVAVGVGVWYGVRTLRGPAAPIASSPPAPIAQSDSSKRVDVARPDGSAPGAYSADSAPADSVPLYQPSSVPPYQNRAVPAQRRAPTHFHFNLQHLDFGEHDTAIKSRARKIIITNSSPQPQKLFLTITGDDETSFLESDNCPNTLAPQKSCSVMVTFVPRAKGSQNAMLSVIDEQSGRGIVSLKGTGK